MPRPSGPTREKILLAAERLFSERGIDGVSIAEITAAAGQRNNSAVQYHFGDKTGLLSALTERHLEQINAHRDELVAAFPQRPTLHDCARIIVEPVGACLATESGRAYLLIQASLLSLSDLDRYPDLLRSPWERPGLVAVTRQLAELLGSHRVRTADIRRSLITGLIFHSFADRIRRGGAGSDEEFTAAVVAAVTSILEMDLD